MVANGGPAIRTAFTVGVRGAADECFQSRMRPRRRDLRVPGAAAMTLRIVWRSMNDHPR